MIFGLIVSAFIMGLLGSTHCIAMCGGVASLFSTGLVKLGRERSQRTDLKSLLAFNGGRLASYAAAGAIAGAFGLLASRVAIVSGAQVGLRVVAAAFTIALGLSLMGASKNLSFVEKIGAPLWARVKPLATKLARARSVGAAVGLGALWGFMPCGLVYAALGVALGTGSTGAGALAMTAFFFGTLPSMLAVGIFARAFGSFARREWVRRAAGAVILIFAALNLQAAVAAALTSNPHACCAHAHMQAAATAGE